MRKLLFIISLCLVGTASGQFFAPHQKPMLGLQINWAQSISYSLVYVGLFNEGSGNTVYDLSGNNHTGTFQATPVWIPGKTGSAIDFDSGDTITCGNTVDVTIPFSFVCLFKSDDVTSTQVMCSTKQTVSNYTGAYLWQDSEAQIVIQFADGTGSGTTDRYAFHSDDTILANQWYHVVCTVKSTTDAAIWINGKSSTWSTSGSATSMVGGNFPCVIGKFTDDNPYPFVGQIDHLMIYDREISAGEASQLYQEKFCMFKPSWDWMLYGAISVPAVGGQVIFIN